MDRNLNKCIFLSYKFVKNHIIFDQIDATIFIFGKKEKLSHMTTVPPTTSDLDDDFNIAQDKLPSFVESFTKCQICYGILKQACDTTCCHNLYCEPCISRWFREHNTCPGCRSRNARCELNIPIQRLTDQIPLTCPYKISGCTSTPSFKDFMTHVNQCEFKNCLIINIENHKNSEDISKASIILKRSPSLALEILDGISTTDSELLLKIKSMKLHCLFLSGRLRESLEGYQQLRQQVSASHGENSLEFSECEIKLAMIWKKLSIYPTAIIHYTSAITILRTLMNLNSGINNELNNESNNNELNTEIYQNKMGQCLSQMADVKRKIDDFNGAEVDYRNALPILTSDSEKAQGYRGLGLICKKRNDYDTAMTHYTKALQLLHNGNEFDYNLGILYGDIGDISRKREKHEDALALYRKALLHLEKTVNPSYCLDLVDIHCSISQILISKLCIDDALSNLLTAENIMKNVEGPHYKKAIILIIRGTINSMQKNYVFSRKNFQDAVEQLGQVMAADHLEIADARIKLVETYIKEREENPQKEFNKDEVINQLDTALVVYRSKLTPSHYKVTECESYRYYLEHGVD